MNTIKRIVLLFVLFLTQDVLLAQTSSVCDSTNWAKPGTYEVISIPGSTEGLSTFNFSIPTATLCEIEKMRKEDKIVEYKLNYCTMIKIYPKIHQSQITIEK